MRELFVTILAMVATAVAFALAADHVLAQVHADLGIAVWQAVLVLLLFAGFTYGSVVYLLSRIGWLRRQRHGLTQGHDLPAAPASTVRTPRVCVLVPSYKEELRVIRQTVVSAALSEYPSKRIVVLVDDPCSGPGVDRKALEATRQLIASLHACFRDECSRYQLAFTDFMHRADAGQALDPAAETHRVAMLYANLAHWVEQLAEPLGGNAFAHVDRFFNDEIVSPLARLHRERSQRLLRGAALDRDALWAEYQRLASLLRTQITRFERKRYRNLSHAPSKAMNLNSYIGLLGRSFKEHVTADGCHLVACAASEADFVVPAEDFLLTLDADSLVRHDYLLKLAPIMAADPRMAVVQTPYSAHPHAASLLERCAGAQTDIQYLVHQGFTFFGATYWVGANALLRVKALNDIRQTAQERGFEVPVFIQDKTVIEDTGSTLDLVRCGWTLHNHPERLAFSATPPDFGALIIQRRRWANGGLVILADLLRYVMRPQGRRPGLLELFVRAHYLLSPTLSSIGVLLLALLPLDPALASPWLAAAALPYLVVYARDLRRCGYSWLDFWRVYALNLMLLPVNAAGVLQSVRQIVMRRKSAFARTPKVGDRTASPALHVATQLGLPAIASTSAVAAAQADQFFLAGFAGFNALCLAWGVVRFIGVREAWHDLKLGCASWYRASARRVLALQAGASAQEPKALPAPERSASLRRLPAASANAD